MRISILSIGAIASVLAMNAFAETTSSTVTSRNYVDAMDDVVYNKLDKIKQDTIPQAGVNADENGGGESVVTYTNTAGTIGERGIYDGSNDYNSSTDADKLVTAAALNNLPTTTVTYKTCTEWSGTPHTDANCLLWSLEEKPIYAKQCHYDSDCANLPGSPYGCATPSCDAGECFCRSL